MNLYRIALMTICCLTLTSVTVHAGSQQLETVEKELIANWKNLKNLSATLRIQADIYNKFGRVTSDGVGNFAIDRNKGKERFYKQIKTTTTNVFNTKPLSTESAGISVTIDDVTQSMADSMDTKYIIRKKAEYNDRRDAPTLLAFLHKVGTVNLLESKSLDGRKVHVIESKYTSLDNLITRIVVHFDDQTGVATRITTYDINNTSVNISTLTITSENKGVLESLFELPTSEDAILIDETKNEKALPTK